MNISTGITQTPEYILWWHSDTRWCIYMSIWFLHIKNIWRRGYIFQKLLLAWIFSCINKNCLFYQGDGYLWPHCYMTNLYISHLSLYAPTYSFWAIGSMLISLFRVTSWFDTVCNIVTLFELWRKLFAWTWTTIIWLQYLEVFRPKYMYSWYYFQFFILTLKSS